MSPPLSNLRVLDLTRVLAGPWATQTLADLGAEVIKIEKPGEGDDTRGWGPPFIEKPDGSHGDAAYFLSANRGKRSVAIDMAKPEGQALIRRLAERSDVLVENFKVGGLKKYGLDHESLKGINPRLVYCSITGFGQTGPYAQRAGYDFMIQGMAGIMSITGQPDGAPGAEPMKVGVAFADIFTGLYATIGILSALAWRERSGQGQLGRHGLARFASRGARQSGAQLPGERYTAHPPRQCPSQYRALPDVRYGRWLHHHRGRQRPAVSRILPHRRGWAPGGRSALCLQPGAGGKPLEPHRPPCRGHEETLDRRMGGALEAAAVPCGPINRLDQVFADPQVKAHELAVELHRPDGTVTPGVANPIRLSASPVEYARAAPALGADTAEVLERILGLCADEIERLRGAGVVA